MDAPTTAAEPKINPAMWAVASVVFVIATVATLASYMPDTPPHWIELTLLGLGALAYLVAVVTLVSTRVFEWATFLNVAKPAFIAVLAATGVIEFAFLYDDTRGFSLTILTLGLGIVALALPLILAYSVARHVPSPKRSG
ncbi:MAG: hypothetical protein F2663_03385 [Actinobacteria bacterium]|uniref:Unannotated protein n=1 Tax=freshwater metagenome TaxID=449393 RepID=A0A6J6NUV5_9ZZZZ|nr:hypothetical protein [Actinomycetota bacterium]